MSSENNIDHMLEKTRPELTNSDRLAMWQRIEGGVAISVPIKSPYYSFISTKIMTSLVVALIFILGAGGTVAASETAKPGDLLFPIERAAERARIILASDAKAVELRNKFAAERVAELRAIIDEEIISTTLATSSETVASSSIRTFTAEADVFTDITVVKVEINDRKSIFTSSLTSKADIVSELVRRYGLSTTTIESALDFEIENRASRPGERGVVSVDTRGEERISIAVNELLDLLDEFDDSEDISGFLSLLMSEIDNVDVSGRDGEVEIKAEDKRLKIDDDRVEIREDGYRIKIKDDGEVKVKYEDDSRDEEENDSKDDDDEEVEYIKPVSTVKTPTVVRLKAEADVFADTTIVEIELNDRKSVFTTTAKTRDAVINEIVSRYGVERTLVSSVLDFSVEVSPVSDDDQGDEDRDEDEEDEREDNEDRRDDEDEREDREDEDEREDREDEEDQEDN